ncbi:MAG TPA: hypothetical protein V6D47_16335 [Oscillatoriaceae cyanobacterium]
MSISPIRPMSAYPTYRAPAPAPASVATAQSTAGPTGGSFGATAGGGMNLLQIGSWFGGAFGAVKIAKAFNFNPAGLGFAAVVGVGAFLGNKLYHMLSGS